MSRQTKYTNTHTPKNTPHILPGKAVSAFEFAYSDKRQVPKNASVSSLLGQWRLSQYLSFSKKCGGVTQEFTLSHHSRLGEIPIYYLSFFVSYNTCFVLDKDKDGLLLVLLVVETSGSYFFFWPLSKLQVAREGQRPQSLRLPTIVTMISLSLWTPWWLIKFLLVHWTNILTPLTFWSIPFKACKFLFNVWFYSLTSDSCWYEFSIFRTWSNRVGNRITNETGSTKVPSSDSLSLFPRIVARVDFLKMPLWSKVWPGCETWNVEIKLPLILSFAADSQK